MGTKSDTSKQTPSPTKSDDNNEKTTEDGELHDDENIKGEDEDIPDDFFDDFSNQDFMDGLDIVDAWDETEKNKKLIKEKEEKKKRRRSGERRSRSSDRKRRSEERKKRLKESKKEASPSKGKPIEKELRRDPAKTKRDLEKDRENYVKKKEQKLISKVVETGLVPPGMETEVNLSEIDVNSKEKEKNNSKKESPKRDERVTSREKMRDRSRERRRRRSRSFERISPRGRSNERRKDRSRERRRDRSRSRNKGWNARNKERARDLSPLQPHFRRRRSRSLSNRERWLTTRKSVSPERKYNRDKADAARISFLEEIKMKLGDPKPTGHYQNQSQPRPPFNIPQMQNVYAAPSILTPAPNQYFSPNQQQQHSPYDQNFFIGNPEPVPPIPPINNIPTNGPPQMVAPTPVLPPQQNHMAGAPVMVNPGPHMGQFGGSLLQPIRPVPPPNPKQIEAVSPMKDVGMKNISQLMEKIKASANAKANQLSIGNQQLTNKLSLTDFLSFHSRPAAFSTDPEALQKKVSVLSRCQDVLKELTGDKKFGGKLVVTKTSKSEQNQRTTNVSPLLRKEPPTFSFTAPKSGAKSTFQSLLNKALIKAGVISPEVIDLDEEETTKQVVPSNVAQMTAASNNKKPGCSSSSSGTKVNNAIMPVKVLMKMCQTDPVKCDECEERNAKQFKSIGIQCGETDRYNVGVQVVEADIANANLPKNQSLAYLTPAQLLGRAEPTSTKVENFGRVVPPLQYRDYGGDYDFRERQRGFGDVDFRLLDVRRGQDYADAAYLSEAAARDPSRYPRF